MNQTSQWKWISFWMSQMKSVAQSYESGKWMNHILIQLYDSNEFRLVWIRWFASQMNHLYESNEFYMKSTIQMKCIVHELNELCIRIIMNQMTQMNHMLHKAEILLYSMNLWVKWTFFMKSHPSSELQLRLSRWIMRQINYESDNSNFVTHMKKMSEKLKWFMWIAWMNRMNQIHLIWIAWIDRQNLTDESNCRFPELDKKKINHMNQTNSVFMLMKSRLNQMNCDS